jgi:hypothetical protein
MKGFRDSNNKFHPISEYQKVRKSSDQKEVGIRLRRDKKIPVYNTKVNWDDKRKPFKMWIVKHPEGSDVVKGSVTIVMAEHFGQAVDDFETIWNKENRMNRKIGYPVIQGTADKNFRYKRDDDVFTQVLKNIDNPRQHGGRLSMLFHEPTLETNRENTIAKLIQPIAKPLFEYKITKPLRIKPNTPKHRTGGTIYWTEDLNTDIAETELKNVAVDAHREGLIENNRVNTLLLNAEFQTSDAQYPKNLDQPVIISLRETNYIVAPFRSDVQ